MSRRNLDIGLPLGNLTSQLLVNIYMNKFDQFVKRESVEDIWPEVPSYEHGRHGNLILVADRLSRNEYPEDGRLGYTPLIVLYW